jgi:hypothetical protein
MGGFIKASRYGKKRPRYIDSSRKMPERFSETSTYWKRKRLVYPPNSIIG